MHHIREGHNMHMYRLVSTNDGSSVFVYPGYTHFSHIWKSVDRSIHLSEHWIGHCSVYTFIIKLPKFILLKTVKIMYY
jgi:hypothetical protein